MMQTVFMILTNFPLQGWEKGDVIPHCWVRAQSVSSETSASLVANFRGSRSEAWILCVTMCVTVFSVSQAQKLELQADAEIQQNQAQVLLLRIWGWAPSGTHQVFLSESQACHHFFPQQIFNYLSCKWNLKELAQDGPLTFFQLPKKLQC